MGTNVCILEVRSIILTFTFYQTKVLVQHTESLTVAVYFNTSSTVLFFTHTATNLWDDFAIKNCLLICDVSYICDDINGYNDACP